jgi:putative peptidoglycan lipid II flippase
MEGIITRGKRILNSQQNTVLSAASLIMIMIVMSSVLGLVRQRVLAYFFTPDQLSLFFAAFRLPDSIFQVLVFGTFSSAFIPVFTKALNTGREKAWEIAGRVVAIGIVIFVVAAILLGVWAPQIYSVIAPGYTDNETILIANLARILFAAQGFFVISYVLTGVLESLRRFLVPALAPLFYNLGIIIGTVFFSSRFDLMGPVLGVVIGAASHFLIQYPLSRKLGFRFVWDFKIDEGVKKIGHLAWPRVVDLAFNQIGSTVELFLSSIISQASYTYFTFANTLQVVPVTLFGTSLAKAVLPLLSGVDENRSEFRRILDVAIFQAIFLSLPVSVALIVLRIPIVRLVYGTKIFDWEATVQTGATLSVFAIGIVTQTLMSILARAFFALHDTMTPVKVSFVGLAVLVLGDFFLIYGLHLPVWALAAAFSLSTYIEAIILIILIHKRVGNVINKSFFVHLTKIFVSVAFSGLSMFFLIKFFDASVWVKRLSFLTRSQTLSNIPFQIFVLDTRYTINVIILTAVAFMIGLLVYLGLCFLLKIPEAKYFLIVAKKMIQKKILPGISQKEQEPISPITGEE